MRALLYAVTVILLCIAMYKSGRASVGNEALAAIQSNQHVKILQELLNSELQYCRQHPERKTQ